MGTASIRDNIIEQALGAPEKVYSSPEDVLADVHLRKEDKRRILDAWAQDKKDMCRAEAENMTVKAPDLVPPAQWLQRIAKAKIMLNEK